MGNQSDSDRSFPANIALAYQGYIEDPVPSKIFDAIVSNKLSRALKLLTAFLLILVGFLSALGIGQLQHKVESPNTSIIMLEQLAVSAHATFAQDAVYPVRVGIEDMDHLARWLSYRMGVQLQIPDLNAIGYTLLGGNIVPDASKVSASLIYESLDGEILSLFIRNAEPIEKINRVVTGQQNGYNWVKFGSALTQFAVVSQQHLSKLRQVSDKIQK